MKQLESNKVIAHIEEAKDWLDKAKEQYIEANSVRGDLNLNLAQAEVKYAWELSRRQNVLLSNKIKRTGVPRYFIPVAATLLVAVGVLAFSLLVVKPANQNLAKAKPVKPVDLVAISPTATAKTDTKSDLARNEKPQANQMALAKHDLPKAVVSEDSVSQVVPRVSRSVEVVPVVVSNNPTRSVSTTNNGEENTREAALQTGTKLQPAIQLAIDEEALAKEASRSLRNGK